MCVCAMYVCACVFGHVCACVFWTMYVRVCDDDDVCVCVRARVRACQSLHCELSQPLRLVEWSLIIARVCLDRQLKGNL